jgi:hypothetical protein
MAAEILPARSLLVQRGKRWLTELRDRIEKH